tara:strand:+ start:47 stop:388 length:342 start_codon:yes stop_codon:yes gene_type:complete
MIVHKNLIIFSSIYLNTKEGQMSQTENDNFKKLKIDIEKNGIINPLICIEKKGKYIIYMGSRRFIAGCLLGIEEYEVKTVSGSWRDDFEKVKILTNAIKKYQRVHKDGTYLAI